jgi:hypothetical protein
VCTSCGRLYNRLMMWMEQTFLLSYCVIRSGPLFNQLQVFFSSFAQFALSHSPINNIFFVISLTQRHLTPLELNVSSWPSTSRHEQSLKAGVELIFSSFRNHHSYVDLALIDSLSTPSLRPSYWILLGISSHHGTHHLGCYCAAVQSFQGETSEQRRRRGGRW